MSKLLLVAALAAFTISGSASAQTDGPAFDRVMSACADKISQVEDAAREHCRTVIQEERSKGWRETYDWPIGVSPGWGDHLPALLQDCQTTASAEAIGGNYYNKGGDACAHDVNAWLFDNRYRSYYDLNFQAPYFPPFAVVDDPELVRLVRCGAAIIAQAGSVNKTAGEILSAEFDKACNGEATM